jgi:hypothetical protein
MVIALTVNPVQLPLVYVYVILVVPAPTPVTTPDEDPTVAIVVLPEVQIPPVVESIKVKFPPTQAKDDPLITGTYKVEPTLAVTDAVLVQAPLVAVTVYTVVDPGNA